MSHIGRTIVALALLALLTSGLARSQSVTSPEVSQKTFSISGNVGLPSVVMQGLPDNPVSAPDGSYKATVPYGWAGKVVPVKKGCAFDPPAKEYTRVTEDRKNDDYVPRVFMFTISGSVGLAGVGMRGLPGEVVTNSDGSYSVSVEYRWSGQVVPFKEGYEFDPPLRDYRSVRENQENEDYVARVVTLTISDRIAIGDEPIEGVKITAQPGDGDAMTDADGRYSIEVPYGWTGKLTLAKEGIDFDPPSIAYSRVTSDIIDGACASGRSSGCADPGQARHGRGPPARSWRATC